MRVGVMDGMSGPIIILNLKVNFTKTAVPSLPLSLSIINLRVISWLHSLLIELIPITVHFEMVW